MPASLFTKRKFKLTSPMYSFTFVVIVYFTVFMLHVYYQSLVNKDIQCILDNSCSRYMQHFTNTKAFSHS